MTKKVMAANSSMPKNTYIVYKLSKVSISGFDSRNLRVEKNHVRISRTGPRNDMVGLGHFRNGFRKLK